MLHIPQIKQSLGGKLFIAVSLRKAYEKLLTEVKTENIGGSKL
jgi:hypothetical protein